MGGCYGYRDREWECGLDTSVSGQGPDACTCRICLEFSSFVEDGKYLDQLSVCQLHSSTLLHGVNYYDVDSLQTTLFEAYLWDGMQMKIARVSFVYCRSTTNCK